MLKEFVTESQRPSIGRRRLEFKSAYMSWSKLFPD